MHEACARPSGTMLHALLFFERECQEPSVTGSKGFFRQSSMHKRRAWDLNFDLQLMRGCVTSKASLMRFEQLSQQWRNCMRNSEVCRSRRGQETQL